MHLRFGSGRPIGIAFHRGISSATATPTTDETFATVTPGGDNAATPAAEATVADVTPVPTVDPTEAALAQAANLEVAMSEIQQPTGDAAATGNDVAVPTTRYLEFLYQRLTPSPRSTASIERREQLPSCGRSSHSAR
jgi:hypothetical protein